MNWQRILVGKDLGKPHFERLNLAECVVSWRSALNWFRMVCGCAHCDFFS
jgi:hypothetical protein